jgi:hypothetical protein
MTGHFTSYETRTDHELATLKHLPYWPPRDIQTATFRKKPVHHSARRLNTLAHKLNLCRYLEIGVSSGGTFRDIEIAERTGVDPHFQFDTSEVVNESTFCIEKTSDNFFADILVTPTWDAVFIDGLHTFEQVVRDFNNTILRTHPRSVILLDDTWPSDIYSAHPDASAALRLRREAGNDSPAWHGDVYKIVYYIHDFWPSLNYRTITQSGNIQTLVWRGNSGNRRPLFNSLERISRLSYFDMQANLSVMRPTDEDEAIDLCVREVMAL